MNDTTIIKFLTVLAWIGLTYGTFAICYVWYLNVKFMREYPNPTRIQSMFAPSLSGKATWIFLLSAAWLAARYFL